MRLPRLSSSVSSGRLHRILVEARPFDKGMDAGKGRKYESECERVLHEKNRQEMEWEEQIGSDDVGESRKMTQRILSQHYESFLINVSSPFILVLIITQCFTSPGGPFFLLIFILYTLPCTLQVCVLTTFPVPLGEELFAEDYEGTWFCPKHQCVCCDALQLNAEPKFERHVSAGFCADLSTYCFYLKFSVVWCGAVWCGVVRCGVVWCGVVWQVATVQCHIMWCGTVS